MAELTTSYIEKEDTFKALLKEAFWAGDITQEQATKALKLARFPSDSAAGKVREWSLNKVTSSENQATTAKRLKDLASYEKQLSKSPHNLGSKKYNELKSSGKLKLIFS